MPVSEPTMPKMTQDVSYADALYKHTRQEELPDNCIFSAFIANLIEYLCLKDNKHLLTSSRHLAHFLANLTSFSYVKRCVCVLSTHEPIGSQT